MLTKPHLGGSLMLQDDHYRRVADLAFRHLAGAGDRFMERRKHEWIKTVPNDDPRYGRAEYLKALGENQFNSSEEYTQALAAVLFTHIWLLSAANYYRLSVKHQKPSGAPWLNCNPIAGTDKPQVIAKALKLPQRIVACAESLHYIRNTISHLVETDPKTERIDDLDFPFAYSLVKCTWVIYCALLRHYGLRPDRGSWAIQARRYNLPFRLDVEK